jgi:hypothetical protein
VDLVAFLADDGLALFDQLGHAIELGLRPLALAALDGIERGARVLCQGLTLGVLLLEKVLSDQSDVSAQELDLPQAVAAGGQQYEQDD